MILNAGTNDIEDGRSATEIIDGLARFVDEARAAGTRVFLTTITPSDHGVHAAPAAERVRSAVNEWIRVEGPSVADGVFDFASSVANLDDDARLSPAFDAGDGLHLSPAGYRALAETVDVGRLTGSPCLAS